MSATEISRRGDRALPFVDSYWHASKRPLQILVFLLPLIVAYEVCLALVLPAADGRHVSTVEAHRSLLLFFGSFGIAPNGGLYLGGAVIVVVLLVWHVLARERWKVDGGVLALMAVEAIFLVIPLLVLSRLSAEARSVLANPGPSSFAEMGLWSQMAISVGAGLYEELMFRMVLIALVHTLLVDVGKTSQLVGTSVAILVSAAAFALYHDLRDDLGGGVSTRKVVFYLLAGLYFGAVYAFRGFGLVVAAHALYDVMTVLLPSVHPADPG
jgi:hypothetical protein